MNVRLRSAIAAGTLALALTACSNGTDAASTSPAVSGDAAAAPAGLVKEGVLSVGMTLPDAPYYIADAENRPTSGITKDLLEAVGEKLGLKVEFTNVAWEGGITGLQAGRYDIYGGSLYDTLERQEAGTFVDFLKEQTTLITRKDSAGKYSTRLDACGGTIATIRGTTDVSYAKKLSEECTAAGKPEMKATEYPTQQDSELALNSGRTELGLQSVAGAAFAIEQGADRAIVAEPFDGGFYVGSMINSKNTQIVDAVAGAMQELYASGKTKEILAKYGVEPVEPGVNLQK